uniref:Immunoglobulin domain-containing protein n=1 Tax=Astyanax mexicanus TaxID=7994 RepID=A0A3B1IXZ3_ASTMX
MRFYSLISSLILSVFLLFISGSESVKTLQYLPARKGGSLTVPCLYAEKYISNRKYWCKGGTWSSCRIVGYTNSSNTGISVTDYPSQNMFTVDLNNLQDSDSGWYWCAVEIGDYGTQDDGYYVYLTVSSDHGLWVKNSRVIGQEGGGVSVQVYYSSEYKNEEKMWCRFKTWSCYTVGKTKTQNSAVMISDDENRGSFRVEMIGLQKSDAGWYWFSAGGVGVTVHLTVTERPTTTTAAVTTLPTTHKTTTSSSTLARAIETTPPATTKLTTNASSAATKNKRNGNGNSMLIWVLLAVAWVLLGLLFLLFVIIICTTRKHRGNPTEASERISDTAVPMVMEDSQPSGLVYSNVAYKKKPSSEPASTNYVVYSTVATAAKNKHVHSAVEDGEVIYSSVVLK